MAGCSSAIGAPATPTPTPTPTTSYSLDLPEVVRRLQSVGFCLDLDVSFERTKHQLAPLFDQVLSLFLSEIVNQGPRPSPRVPGDGHPIDLFKLFCSVREKGGYDAVTAASCWGPVAEESGMDSRAASSVKLVYAKYLGALDRWLQKILDVKDTVPDTPAAAPPPHGEVLDQKEMEATTTPRGSKTGRLWTPTKGKQPKLQLENVVEQGEDDDEVMILEKTTFDNAVSSSHKREKEALVGMLDWVKTIAKNPGHPSIGTKSRGASEKSVHGINQFSQVLLVHEAMLVTCPGPGDSVPQKRQMPHPSFYEDYTSADDHTDEKLRCSQRIINKQSGPDMEKNPMAYKRLKSCSARGSLEIQEWIPVDPVPEARASVPPWTGPVTSSDWDDSKWLGTRIWPPETKEKKSIVQQDPIGKGREDNCRCEYHGSVDCVRLHVAEKRLELKYVIRSAFHHWRFHHMGEEVALSWTEEEERKFKAIVRESTQVPNKSFWEQLYVNFPSKSHRSLVSYYFNVFLLRRRSYQNRVTPNNIDSDDEESEFGFLSNPFGHNAVKVPDSKPIFCAQNAQCLDIDEFTDMDFQSILDNLEWDL